MLIIESVWEWDNTVKAFKAGFNSNLPKAEQIK
jgi:hypothetical protein